MKKRIAAVVVAVVLVIGIYCGMTTYAASEPKSVPFEMTYAGTVLEIKQYASHEPAYERGRAWIKVRFTEMGDSMQQNDIWLPLQEALVPGVCMLFTDGTIYPSIHVEGKILDRYQIEVPQEEHAYAALIYDDRVAETCTITDISVSAYHSVQ